MHNSVRTFLFCSISACFAAQWDKPIRFEPVDAAATRFTARGLDYRFSISASEAIVSAGRETVRMRFDGAHASKLEGTARLPAATNILKGNDPALWRRGIPNFARIVAHEIYPGIDIEYYGAEGGLEYDLVLHPGADSRQIRLRIDGAAASLDAEGNLVAGLIHKHPVTYQMAAGGSRRPIASRYRRNADGSFGFQLARYDRRSPLIIDPQLALSAYLSGSNQDIATAIGHDRNGFVYVAGTTFSTDLPATTDAAFQATNNGSSDLFVAKIDPNGSQVVYLTYVGGSGADLLNDMAVGGDGTVYLTGSTTSIDFPLGNAAQSTLSGTSDGFVLWLDPSQSGPAAIYYGTYLGGSGNDAGNGIAVDARGRILVTGQTKSTDFPANGGYLASSAGSSDAFMAMIDTSQAGAATLAYSTYLGGGGWDAGRGIAAAPDGTAWVTGATYSGDFPMAGLSYQTSYQGGGDVFLTQINPNAAGGSSLVYSTYLGGTNTDEGNRVFVDTTGRVIVTGFTLSPDLPITSTAVQGLLGRGSANAGAANAFVAALKPANSGNPVSQLVYSTYLGGTGGDEGYGVTADAAGNIYVAGLTKSVDFPVTSSALQKTLSGGPAGFVVKLNPARPPLDYSSYIASTGNQTAYGIDLDAKGTVYLAGFTSGPLLDALGGATKTSNPGDSDAFVLGFNPCSFTVTPGSAQFAAAGGTATIAVSTAAGCTWTVSNTVSWISSTPASGTGSGSVTLTAAANATGVARSGTLTVAGVAVAVTQAQ